MKRAPSIKQLNSALGLMPGQAEQIRGLIHGTYGKRCAQVAMKLIAELIPGSFGCETISGTEQEEAGWPIAEYVNMGDTYYMTILYNYQEGTFSLTTMGDFVEQYSDKYGIE